MMKNRVLGIAITLSFVLLAGCATPARIEQMSATSSAQHRTTNTPLRNNLAIKDITGGTETNPMWVSKVSSSDFEEALEASLKSAGLLADRQAGDFVLTADLMKLEQPFIGIDMTVTSSVRYMVVERATGKTVFDSTLTTPYTAKFSDALIGMERLKLANEGAIRTNIGELLSRLVQLKIEGVALTN